MRRRTLLLVFVVCLGCQTALQPNHATREYERDKSTRAAPTKTLATTAPGTTPAHAATVDPPSALTPASHERAAGGARLTPASPARADVTPVADSERERRHLTLAAAYLEKGQDEKACHHLGLFLERHPHHGNVRFYHAELLMRLGRLPEARLEYEHVIADLQEEQALDVKHLTHCHSRLAELSEREEDEFARQLHRGIALYWLSQAPAASAEEDDLVPAEGLLCKAVDALQHAYRLDPEQARPCWYLHNVWRKLGQAHPAARFLHLAQTHSAFSPLTPAEQRGLILAQK